MLLLPSEVPKFRTSQLVAYFRCPFSFADAVVSYGYCCSCYSCSTKIEKEKELTTQEHKKPTSKRNPRNSKPGKICHFQH
jgi:hypothetical protein